LTAGLCFDANANTLSLFDSRDVLNIISLHFLYVRPDAKLE
jgi:hypothetical protein